MSKAKYQRARLRHTTESGNEGWDIVLPIDIADAPPKGDLLCVGCQALMKLTSSFTRRSGTEVPAYLSLYPRTDHAADCSLNIETLHGELRASHPDSIAIEDKILYLHLPDEERTKNLQSERRRTGSGSGDSWTSTMHSAAAIARFLNQYDDPGDLLNQIKIRYRDHRGEISVMFWADFCFPARSPQALQHLRRLQRDGDRTPPVAVIFPAKATTTNDTVRSMRVDTFQRPLAGRPDHKLFLSIAEPLDPDRNRLDTITTPTVLALGHAKYFDWGSMPVTEMRITVKESGQLSPL